MVDHIPLVRRLESLDRTIRQNPKNFERILESEIIPLAQQSFTTEVAELPSGLTIALLSRREIMQRVRKGLPPGATVSEFTAQTVKTHPEDPGEIRLNVDDLLYRSSHNDSVRRNAGSGAYAVMYHELGHGATPLLETEPEDLTTPMANGDKNLTVKQGLSLMPYDQELAKNGVFLVGIRHDEDESLIELQVIEHFQKHGLPIIQTTYRGAALYRRRIALPHFPNDHKVLHDLQRAGKQIEFFRVLGERLMSSVNGSVDPVAYGESKLHQAITDPSHVSW